LWFCRLQILTMDWQKPTCLVKHFLLLLHGLSLNCYLHDCNMWIHMYWTFIHKPFIHVFIRYLMTYSSLQMFCLFKVIKRLDLQIGCMYFMFTCEYVLFQLIFQRISRHAFCVVSKDWCQQFEERFFLFTPIPMLSLVMCSNYLHSPPSFIWYVTGLGSCPCQWKWGSVSCCMVSC
jgi:hypothetical protein